MSVLLVRKLHKYAGALFAPALLFFCVTGLLQTFDLHKARGGAAPSGLVLKLAALHKSQTLQTARAPSGGASRGKAADKPARAPAPPPPLAVQLMKLFVAGASITLGATTLAGVYMSLRGPRGQLLVWAMLVLGVAAPAALMALM